MPIAIFFMTATLCVGSSVLLVSRLERLGERLGLEEALLGLVVALATDGPEITSAVAAIVTGQRTIGMDVALGSNARKSPPTTIADLPAYLMLTFATVALAMMGRGLARRAGLRIIAGHVVYVALVVAT